VAVSPAAQHLNLWYPHAPDRGNLVVAFPAGEDEPVPLVEAHGPLVVGRDVEIDVLGVAVPGQVALEQQVPDSPCVEGGQHVQRADPMAPVVHDARVRVADDPSAADRHEAPG
jgi:hypothetical protein